ncbi:uncharacterized protein VTP21DRAFT_8304 [Calcarisporiella thermophila]|uniref:uncharacterized protein n=1 Tax=Calcarisporiella thermophila TaxID=911321 RepID=UPI00374210C4
MAAVEPLTMFIIIRRDLIKSLGWNTGSVIAQASHASTAVLWQYKDTPATQEYLSNLDTMHKVVLETKNLDTLQSIASSLEQLNVPHKVWIEQPENFATCLATAPIHRTPELKAALKKCSLFK